MDMFFVSSAGLFDVSNMLANLQSEWSSNSCEVPSADFSCGGVATELESLCEQYVNLYNAMSELIQNTMDMFSKIGETLDSVDGEMSDSLVEG